MPPSADLSAPPPTKKRVSALVSAFENASAPTQRASATATPPLRRGLRRSVVLDEKTEELPAKTPERAATVARAESGPQISKLSEMDWSPKLVTSAGSVPSKTKTTPAQESLQNHLLAPTAPSKAVDLRTFKPARLAPPPPSTTATPTAPLLLSPPASKGEPAQPILIPARVSLPQGGDGKANLSIARKPVPLLATDEAELKSALAPPSPASASAQTPAHARVPSPTEIVPKLSVSSSSESAVLLKTTSKTPESQAVATKKSEARALTPRKEVDEEKQERSKAQAPLSVEPSPSLPSPLLPSYSTSVLLSDLYSRIVPSTPPFESSVSDSSKYPFPSPTSIDVPFPVDHHHPSRPLLFRSPSTAATTYNLPAAALFRPNSKPLALPDLDVYLDGLGGPKFSDPSVVCSEVEKKRLAAWATGREAIGWWGKWKSRLVGRDKGAASVTDDEAETLSSHGDGKSSEIFPPMDLLPPDLTVMDLKLNRWKKPPLLSLNALLSASINGVLGAEGSTYGLSLTNVESFRDLMQMLTLLISGATSSVDLSTRTWYRTLFVQVPSIFALDFVSAFGMAVVWLWIFTAISAFGVYELWRFTCPPSKDHPSNDAGEGLDRDDDSSTFPERNKTSWRNSRAWKRTVTFLVTSMYLPLSKISVGVLAWTSDMWALESNPYLLTDDPAPAALGPASEFYDTLDFCYKTTMKRPDGIKHFNWAYIILPVAVVTLLIMTLWVPYRLYCVIKSEVPRVDRYTELGSLRMDMTGEYQRLLDNDRSPFSFLYREYRKPWAHFKAIYMGVKLVNILLVVLLTKNNCIFRHRSTNSLAVIQQSSLLAFMALFLVASATSRPYLDFISNNSDRVSRISFVLISFIGLLVALKVSGYAELGGGVLVTVNVVTYLLNGYFQIIGTQWAQRLVKIVQHRLDFSIDLFSPNVNLAKHVSRRIWQETISTILLASNEFKFPEEKKQQVLTFTDDANVAPQLLNFQGSQAERLIEQFKILRTIGIEAYSQALSDGSGSSSSRLAQLRSCIEHNLTGPDIVWQSPSSSGQPGFGRADVVAFPFVVIFRPDDSRSNRSYISSIDDLERFVQQNESSLVQQRRQVRIALRSLEGQSIFAPYAKIQLVGQHRSTRVETRVSYRIGTVKIERNSSFQWRGYNYSSGFAVKVLYVDGQGQDATGATVYDQKLEVNGRELGIEDDFRLTPELAKLLRQNRHLVEPNVRHIEDLLMSHRDFFRNRAAWKSHSLTPNFLFNVIAAEDLTPTELDHVLRTTEASPQVQELAVRHRGAVVFAAERMALITSSTVREWWFLLFDDLWRRNAATVSALRSNPTAFSPHYRSSICYKPLSRPRFETFLAEQGLWIAEGSKGFFNNGFLNRIYFYLNETIFDPSSLAIPVHFSSSKTSPGFDHLEHIPHPMDSAPPLRQSQLTQATFNTGDGTSYDDSDIRLRSAFAWEQMYCPPPVRFETGQKWEWIKWKWGVWRYECETWFGLHPYRHEHDAAKRGVTVDLRNGDEGWELPRLKGGTGEKL